MRTPDAEDELFELPAMNHNDWQRLQWSTTKLNRNRHR